MIKILLIKYFIKIDSYFMEKFHFLDIIINYIYYYNVFVKKVFFIF